MLEKIKYQIVHSISNIYDTQLKCSLRESTLVSRLKTKRPATGRRSYKKC